MACMLNYFDIIFYMFSKMGLSQNGLLQNPVVVQPSNFPNEMAIFKHGAYAIPFLDNPSAFPMATEILRENMAGMLNMKPFSPTIQ